jgi:two-component system torCAD operon response regulator TorR
VNLPAILLVGADTARLSGLADLFENEEFSCLFAASEAGADETLAQGQTDLIVLDGRIGGRGAMEMCARLAASRAAPIIVLSDEPDVTDRIIALEIGADALLSRAFDRRDLIATARALIRRSHRSRRRTSASAERGVLHLRSRLLVGPGGVRTSLAPSLFGLLWIFVSHPGQLVSTEVAADLLGQKKVMTDVHFRTLVARLRNKLTIVGLDGAALNLVRREGYVLDPAVQIELRSDGGSQGARGASQLFLRMPSERRQ